ncbi:SGNH/GDSL hydrolase family protein [Solwaraspora sp. WMMB335]|uniref:SGNH/GDSL hydrolase family protein n=1 Tax=Solwaraspora sp. WMMB335 TaxID=3404118 RepID=UPI003B943664
MSTVGHRPSPTGRITIGRTTFVRTAQLAAFSAGATAATAIAAAGLLYGQARQARRIIPLAEAPPPRCDGLYGARLPGKPLTMVVLGDSSAAGYGVHRPRETPGALLATGISRRLRRPVRLHRLAVVGARSEGLVPQVEAAVELRPELAVILIGGNDVTARTPVDVAVGHLVDTVRRLRAAGTEVVVGTCPDLGAIKPIQPPLRWLARRWSRQLAAAQTVAVVEAGAWTVSLGDLLGPRFAAEPTRLYSWDRFHPSAEGYAVAAAVLLPAALGALGASTASRTAVAGREKVRTLPQAAHEAVRHAGTEVRGTRVGGHERGPAGRWARLRRRPALSGRSWQTVALRWLLGPSGAGVERETDHPQQPMPTGSQPGLSTTAQDC